MAPAAAVPSRTAVPGGPTRRLEACTCVAKRATNAPARVGRRGRCAADCDCHWRDHRAESYRGPRKNLRTDHTPPPGSPSASVPPSLGQSSPPDSVSLFSPPRLTAKQTSCVDWLAACRQIGSRINWKSGGCSACRRAREPFARKTCAPKNSISRPGARWPARTLWSSPRSTPRRWCCRAGWRCGRRRRRTGSGWHRRTGCLSDGRRAGRDRRGCSRRGEDSAGHSSAGVARR
jgi:hypothetical protein